MIKAMINRFKMKKQLERESELEEYFKAVEELNTYKEERLKSLEEEE